MSIVKIAFRNSKVTDTVKQGKKNRRTDKESRIFLLIAGALLLGMLLGQVAKIIMGLEPFARYVVGGGAAFLTAVAWFILAFSRQERKHELMLAGYEEKQRFYYGLLDSLFAALDDFNQGSKNPAEEVLIYLQGYRTEFYTYADGKVIEAVDAWIRAAEAVAKPAADFEGRDSSSLHKRGKAIIKAVKEDLCQEGVEYTDETIFPLLAPPAAAAPLLRRLK